jgi:hypothetical protein
MDADPHQRHQQNDGDGQWEDYSTGWAQYNTTPVREYGGLTKFLSFRKPNSISWDTIPFHKEEREMD